jgi:nucleotide-binding universal stress UspA family protein
MKLLIAIKDTSEESRNILNIGATIAKGISADLSLIYVGKKSSALLEGDVSMARRSLAEWNILHPGLEILEWAYKTILEMGFATSVEGGFDPKNLIEEKRRIRMVLPQSSGNKISLILREGDLMSELSHEVDHHQYELAIINRPRRKRTTHQLIQFLNTSVFVVGNFDPQWNYKILLCVDDSRATKRAIVFGTQVAKQFDAEIRVLTVSKTVSFGKGYNNAHKWAEKYLKHMKIEYSLSKLSGNPTDVFVNEAGDNHIIIMGKAKGNEFLKYFKGSKPIHTAQNANCPVLIVN